MSQADIRRRSARILVAASVAFAAAGCAGENIFGLAVGAGTGDPTVTITSPAEGATATLNATLGVAFDLNAPKGATSYTVVGRYADGSGQAYQQVTANINTPAASSFVTLQPAAGQTAGDAYIVTTVTDIAGTVGSDSVKVTITG